MKKERFETQVLAKLILIVLSIQIYSIINSYKISNDKTILSYQKYMKTFSNRLESFMLAVTKQKLKQFLEKFILINIQPHQEVETKKGKTACIHSIIELSEYPEILDVREICPLN